MRTAAKVFYFCPKTGYFLVLQFIFRSSVGRDLLTFQEIKPQLCFLLCSGTCLCLLRTSYFRYHEFHYFFSFNGFYLTCFLNFISFFYDRTDVKYNFCFNRFFLVNILLILISCVNISK